MKQLNFQVDDRVYIRLASLAREKGEAVTRYARMLFEAAYAARFNNSGDRHLDAIVGATAVLYFADRKDTATIALAVGVSEQAVLRIVKAWREALTP